MVYYWHCCTFYCLKTTPLMCMCAPPPPPHVRQPSSHHHHHHPPALHTLLFFLFSPTTCSGATPVLIASTVVEVGVDVPEASLMLVESASRFGLAQLHQLRGRVGRGSRASRCFLVAPPPGSAGADEAAERLRVLERSCDGLVIANEDLRLRCAGQFRCSRRPLVLG